MSLDANVTLVVPILNEASSLLELLESIKLQTLYPDEIIFCDAGSTDGSQALIQEWWAAKSWNGTSLKIISLPRAMPGAGRNAGVRAARNDWVAFLDGGIIPKVNWLRELYVFSQKTHSDAVFGVCCFTGCDAFQKAVCALSYGQGSSHPVIPASLFSKSVFEKIGYFPEQLRAGEDILWLKTFLTLYTTRHVCKKAIVNYTHFPDSWFNAVRKWQIYEFYCVQAGVRGGQQYLYLLSPLVLFFIAFQGQVYLFGVVLFYFVLRGCVDPIRRSRARPWWGDSPKAALITPFLALILDISKWCGIVLGMYFKYSRKIGLAR
jgi:glycosyltransferase involved in cell wall biosynthesis